MLDIKFIRENKDLVKRCIQNRGLDFELDKLLRLDDTRRKILLELESLRHKKNLANDEITSLLKQKEDPRKKIQAMKKIARDIDILEKKIKEIRLKFNELIYSVPNIAHNSVPVGSKDAKKLIRSWGKIRKFDFKPLSHIRLAEHLGIIDFARASKIAGSNFVLYRAQGARLERALINFMLDLHTKKHGYTEVFPPFLVNRKSMTGTGQLPKLEEDMYKLSQDDYFLIPTAEVPVTNIFQDELLSDKDLPMYFTAYTACFRREAGSYGKDTKGLVRVHQFNKVELVKFTRPSESYKELELLLHDAEEVLQLLELPYRIVMLSTADLSFAASMCYDIEVYSPGIDAWLEVSSCSNFEDFQARRANIRYRDGKTKNLGFVHTLNGSGVALARCVVAILENQQQRDGSIIIPKALKPYMDGKDKIIKPQ